MLSNCREIGTPIFQQVDCCDNQAKCQEFTPPKHDRQPITREWESLALYYRYSTRVLTRGIYKPHRNDPIFPWNKTHRSRLYPPLSPFYTFMLTMERLPPFVASGHRPPSAHPGLSLPLRLLQISLPLSRFPSGGCVDSKLKRIPTA